MRCMQLKTENRFIPSRSVLYEIYPRSFRDTNADGDGDLRGVSEKLGYLKELGINAIWISPFYPSPMKDGGYDVSDYCDVNPLFGNINDAEELIREAHKRGISVVIDLVLNHTSVRHPWFLESMSSRNSSKRDWFIWRDSVDGHEPTNWISAFGGSAWKYDGKTGQYYLHSFLEEQADLNWENPEVVEAIKNVMKFWFEKGVDGFRLDAVNFIGKDPRFLDEPQNPDYIKGQMEPYYQLSHIYSKNQDSSFVHLAMLADFVQRYDGRFLIPEAYPDQRGIEAILEYKKYYERLNNKVVAPFNFELIFLPWNALEYRSFVDSYTGSLSAGQLPIIVLGNHDRSRIATRIGDAQAKVAAVMMMTLPGMPVIYYGDEIGMHDVKDIPPERVQDPYGFQEPGFGRDPERTPMQWNGSLNAGFTEGNPWLPVHGDFLAVNVEEERKDPRSFFELYRNLIQLRGKSQALTEGTYVSVDVGSDRVYGYVRVFGESKFIVLLNFSDVAQPCSFPSGSVQVVLSTHKQRMLKEVCDISSIVLFPNEASVFRVGSVRGSSF